MKVILYQKLRCNTEILELWHTSPIAMSVTSIMAVHVILMTRRHHCGKDQCSFSAVKQHKALSLDKITRKSNLLISRPCALCHRLKAICNSHTSIASLVCNAYIARIRCFTVCSGSNCKWLLFNIPHAFFCKTDFYRVP